MQWRLTGVKKVYSSCDWKSSSPRGSMVDSWCTHAVPRGLTWVHRGLTMSAPWIHHKSTWVHRVPIFGKLSVDTRATPPYSTLLSNFCSPTLVISCVPDEIWPIRITRGHQWTHMGPQRTHGETTVDPHGSTMGPHWTHHASTCTHVDSWTCHYRKS